MTLIARLLRRLGVVTHVTVTFATPRRSPTFWAWAPLDTRSRLTGDEMSSGEVRQSGRWTPARCLRPALEDLDAQLPSWKPVVVHTSDSKLLSFGRIGRCWFVEGRDQANALRRRLRRHLSSSRPPRPPRPQPTARPAQVVKLWADASLDPKSGRAVAAWMVSGRLTVEELAGVSGSTAAEFAAAVRALEATAAADVGAVRVLCDCKTVIAAISRFVASGDRSSAGLSVPDMWWDRLVAACEGRWVETQWVRGHAGVRQQCRVDRAARTELRRLRDLDATDGLNTGVLASGGRAIAGDVAAVGVSERVLVSV